MCREGKKIANTTINGPCTDVDSIPTEEARERIYDEPHARLSKECSSPPPTEPEYYNQIMITYSRSKESQHGTEEGGTVVMPPGAKPIPPPKPKKSTLNDNTGTDIHQHYNNTTLYTIIMINTRI